MHNFIFDDKRFLNTNANSDILFDIEWHKKKHGDNLEVCIDKNGQIFYSRPAHMSFLIRKSCEKLNVSEEELKNMCPSGNYQIFMKWLCEKAEMIAVWKEFYIGNANEKQLLALKKLEDNELFSNKGISFFNN